MIDLTQGKYKHKEVLKELKKDRYINFRYFLLDKNNRIIGELYYVTGSISFDSSCQIMRTGQFNIKEEEYQDINVVDERIRVDFCIKMPDGEWLNYSLGIFVLSSPIRSKKDNIISRNVEAYDLSVIVKEDKLANRYLIKKGKYYTNEIENLLISAGVILIDVPAAALTVNEDLEYEIGTPKIDVINDLLQAINYTPIYFNQSGFATAFPYILPVKRQIEEKYVTDGQSILLSGMEQNLDLFSAPNQFIRYLETPEKAEMKSIYTNEDPMNRLSVVRRGRKIVDIEKVSDIADQSTLDALTKRVAVEKTQVYETIQFSTAIMPHHSYKNCIFVENKELNLSGKYIESSWNIELSVGGKMSHVCRKVVPFL